ncbi:MAG: hypothetical protein LBV40_01140 [Methanomicrobiales archaeon]|nr:hypothetical protein [Methanomicrobiales archaeon]
MFKINGEKLEIERFPDETQRLNIAVDTPHVTIEWLFEKDEEMTLFFVVKHLREKYAVKTIHLYMPYIPHARMDRVNSQRQVFTLKYFCDFINSLCFAKVIVRDAHSHVSLALLNNVASEPIDAIIKHLTDVLLDAKRDIVFYPDEGSSKRYAKLISFPYIFGIKTRDWSTGQILTLDMHGEVPKPPFHVLIVDDISSYGGTFLHSAKKLKELGADKIYLYITHCENAILKGELIHSGLIAKIYTTQSIFTQNHPLIEVIGGTICE